MTDKHRTEDADGTVIEITTIRRGMSKSGKWHDGPEGCTLPVEECKCGKEETKGEEPCRQGSPEAMTQSEGKRPE